MKRLDLVLIFMIAHSVIELFYPEYEQLQDITLGIMFGLYLYERFDK